MSLSLSVQPSIEPYVSLAAPSNLTDLQTAEGKTAVRDGDVGDGVRSVGWVIGAQ